ncbi:MAG: serine hydrolase domain-containing protein [Hyphomonadaceae bacterium]
MSDRLNFKGVRHALAGGLAALLAACATQTAPDSSAASAARDTSWPTASDVVQDAGFTEFGLGVLDAQLKGVVGAGEVPGMSYVLIKDGKVADFKTYGSLTYRGAPIEEDTLFRIRSMSKPVTGVAMMQLWEQGKFQLDDPVTKYVPEFKNLRVYVSGDPANGDLVTEPVSRPMTMRDLFTHTAGFGYGLNDRTVVDRMFIADHPMTQKDLKAAIDRITEIPLIAQPETKWSYSIAIDVQGAIVERLSGLSFGDYLERNIFAPLGMANSGFWLTDAEASRLATVYTYDADRGMMVEFPDPSNRTFFKKDHMESGGGGLVSTLHDYARFAQMLANGGELDGARILKPETVELMMQNHLPDGMTAFGGGWGLGGAIATNPPSKRNPQQQGTFSWFGIDGTWFWVDPANDVVFVGMIQRRGPGKPGSMNVRTESVEMVYDAMDKK